MSAITPLFGALFALIYLVLSVNVIRYRFGNKISLGNGGNKHLEMAARAHANFIEYVPLALLLMWFLESLTLSSNEVFWAGSILLLARVAHAFGMLYPRQLLIMRQLGAIATFAVLIKLSISLLKHYLPLVI
jgi:uncharacterized membrane protein YecN with MAPEG domain